MSKITIPVAAALLLSGLGAGWTGAAVAQDHHNPVDSVSNPGALDYPDVALGIRDLTERFQRDGQVREPLAFATIKPGLTEADVQSALGQPLRNSKPDARTWNYNFKFRMPDSGNYIVCQYKVLFDLDQRVMKSVWRRRQCQNIANSL
ncbi:MAG: outer membrane protein assembly factor BamE [Gammaproteobacteria bacterium]|nr:outer membrane protein assembly factor BamE [Novosphingobium sp.]MCP5143196.1 outer membrane protein assembly factor BamE [Gammaproteobacteria bacterium]